MNEEERIVGALREAYKEGELVAAIKTDVFDMAYLSGGGE